MKPPKRPPKAVPEIMQAPYMPSVPFGALCIHRTVLATEKWGHANPAMANAKELSIRDRWKGKYAEIKISMGKNVRRSEAVLMVLRVFFCLCVLMRM